MKLTVEIVRQDTGYFVFFNEIGVFARVVERFDNILLARFNSISLETYEELDMYWIIKDEKVVGSTDRRDVANRVLQKIVR